MRSIGTLKWNVSFLHVISGVCQIKYRLLAKNGVGGVGGRPVRERCFSSSKPEANDSARHTAIAKQEYHDWKSRLVFNDNVL